MIRIHAFRDPIRPWRLIGFERLDRARAERPGRPARLGWRLFRLNPWMPREGMDRRASLEAEFGGPARAASVYGAIARAAKAEGLAVDFDAIARRPDATPAHRVLARAAAGLGEAFAAALFDACFHRARDIGATETLLACAAAAGLTGEAARAALAAADGDAAIAEVKARARALGVEGAPAYLIGCRAPPGAALPTEAWRRLFDARRAAPAA